MTPETRVGLVTILALVLIIGMVAFLRGGTLRGPQGYELHVVMRDATGLEPGTPVRLSGVTVGQVTDVGLTPEHLARVTITVDPDVRIPADSRFQTAAPRSNSTATTSRAAGRSFRVACQRGAS